MPVAELDFYYTSAVRVSCGSLQASSADLSSVKIMLIGM